MDTLGRSLVPRQSPNRPETEASVTFVPGRCQRCPRPSGELSLAPAPKPNPPSTKLPGSMNDVAASVRLVDIAREHFPRLRIVARARNVGHYLDLRARGVDQIERETFESSLRVGRRTLEVLVVGPFEARELADSFRTHNVGTLEKLLPHLSDDARRMSVARASRAQLEGQFAQDRAAREKANRAWTSPDPNRVPATPPMRPSTRPRTPDPSGNDPRTPANQSVARRPRQRSAKTPSDIEPLREPLGPVGCGRRSGFRTGGGGKLGKHERGEDEVEERVGRDSDCEARSGCRLARERRQLEARRSRPRGPAAAAHAMQPCPLRASLLRRHSFRSQGART